MPKADKVKKTKKEKMVHPNSRKAQQLNRAQVRGDVRLKRKAERQEKEGSLWEKVLWFREQLEGGKDRYSVAEVSDLISKYINRFDDRLDEIKQINEQNKQTGRHGLAHASEAAGIKMVQEKDMNMFVTGQFEAPDITNRVNLKALRQLEGDWKELPRIKLRKFKQVDPATMETEEMEEGGDDEDKLPEAETVPVATNEEKENIETEISS